MRSTKSRRVLVVLAIAGLLTMLALAAVVGHRALVAKRALEGAQVQVTALRSTVGQPDHDLVAEYTDLQARTARAVEQTHTPGWALFEHVWWVGPNLKAFRKTTETVDSLVRDGAGPLATAANGVSLDDLKPHDGRFDLELPQKLAPGAAQLDDAVQAAETKLAAINTADLTPRLREPIEKLRGQLHQVSPLTHQLRIVLPMIAPALGGEGVRHYLLMFQNNAEERASGGNPAAMAMLVAKDGKLTLDRQASSTDFPAPYRKPPYTPAGDGNGDWAKIYGDYVSTYVTNITMTPDFPSTARMAKAIWQHTFPGQVDGVISFDPVALSHLLAVTGPVTLTGGNTIDSSNAVSFLLYGVYVKYSDAKKQDAVFASTARRVFTAVTSGKGSPKAYLDQFGPMAEERRFKVWSSHADEQALIIDSAVGNMLPADNTAATVLGVYNNDDATSKMSYFMDEKVNVKTNNCQATPTYTVTATVVNTLPANKATSLPEYVRAHQRGIPVGGDRQWVQVYGPAGSTLQSVSVDGKPVRWGTNIDHRLNTNPAATGTKSRRPAVRGTMYSRSVGVVSVTLGPDSEKSVTAVFSGHPEDSRTVRVSHTPKVREVPVKVTAASCPAR